MRVFKQVLKYDDKWCRLVEFEAEEIILKEIEKMLNGKVTVVTGSGQGIGRAIALAVASKGAKVVTNNRQPITSGGDAEATARKIRETGGEAIPGFSDISRSEDARKLIQACLTLIQHK